MAQQASIAVYDGAATPVLHTLQPVDNKVTVDGTRVAIWRENLSGVTLEAQVRAELRQKVLKSRVVETRFRTVFPVMESISGANASGYTANPKVAYEDTFETVNWSHPRSTNLSKKICAQAHRNILNNVSTSVAAVAAGVYHDAAVDGFMPT